MINLPQHTNIQIVMKVVLLCRVSTESQDYTRQVNELTDYCDSHKWSIEKVFANKISGAKKASERPEIMEMIDYIQTNQIDKVCVLEISRLGRNTIEALSIIQILNENNVCLFIRNYHLETIVNGKINPITNLICTILLEIAQMERITIVERMKSGREQYIARCRKEGIKMGRPNTYHKSDEAMMEEYSKEISLLRKGLSLRNILSIIGSSITTIRKHYRIKTFKNEGKQSTQLKDINTIEAKGDVDMTISQFVLVAIHESMKFPLPLF